MWCEHRNRGIAFHLFSRIIISTEERFKGTLSLSDLADVDAVVEAVFEDMQLKKGRTEAEGRQESSLPC